EFFISKNCTQNALIFPPLTTAPIHTHNVIYLPVSFAYLDINGNTYLMLFPLSHAPISLLSPMERIPFLPVDSHENVLNHESEFSSPHFSQFLASFLSPNSIY